jgi:hypothetical protein
MIRFVDLTDDYWTDPEEGKPVCAFLSTTSDCFLENACGSHTFDSMEEIEEHPNADRFIGLMPEGFFDEEKPLTMEEYNEACRREHDMRILIGGKHEQTT